MRTQKFPFLAAILIVIVFSCFSEPGHLKESGTSIVPLRTVDPMDNNLSDLLPVQKSIEGKRIVGLGEATHGTKEFAQIKHRLFKFLVLHAKAKVLAVELSYSGCLAVNEYIVNNKINGSKEELFSHINFWMFQTDECISLIEWMHTYNLDKTEEEKISIFGFSPSPGPSLQYIQTHLASSFRKEKQFFTRVKYDSQDGILNNKAGSAGRNDPTVDSMLYYIASLKGKLNDGSLFLKRALEELNQYILFEIDQSSDPTNTFFDSCMASNISYIESQFPNNLAVVWAHNGHIWCKKVPGRKYGYESMGSFLKNRYGDKYFPIGLEFNEGTFMAFGRTEEGGTTLRCSLVPRKNSLPYKLSGFHVPLFFIDLKQPLRGKKMNSLFATRQYMHDIGATCKDQKDAYYPETAKSSYDGLIYIEKSTFPGINYLKSVGKK